MGKNIQKTIQKPINQFEFPKAKQYMKAIQLSNLSRYFMENGFKSFPIHTSL